MPMNGYYFPVSYGLTTASVFVIILSFSPRNFGYLMNPSEVYAMILFKV